MWIGDIGKKYKWKKFIIFFMENEGEVTEESQLSDLGDK